MNEAEEFLREHGHIPTHVNILPDYQAPEKSYVISDETLHELMRVFAEQYAKQVSGKSILDEQALADEKEQAEKRYGIDNVTLTQIYLEGLKDGARCYIFPNHQNQEDES